MADAFKAGAARLAIYGEDPMLLSGQDPEKVSRANRARSYPKLSVSGNFGEIGRSIGGVQSTGLLQGQIDFTLFDRDRSGEAPELASRVKRIDDQIADMRRGIDEDIREAKERWVRATPTFFINGRRFVGRRQLRGGGFNFIERALKK